MAGITVPILMQRHFDFSYLTGTNSETLTLHTALPVIPYRTGLLQIRVHSINIDEGPQMELHVYPTLPCKTDGRQFANTDSGYEVASIVVNEYSPVPGYLHAAITSLDAAYLLIELEATQFTSGLNLAAQLSAELLLRED